MNDISTSGQFTERFDAALQYASEAHRTQTRKSSATPGLAVAPTEIPYIGHLLAVASIVIDAGGTEEEAIAALLHDVAEDQGGEARLTDVAERFDDRIAEIVRGLSDVVPVGSERKPAWPKRKQDYIDHLTASRDVAVYLVSAADKCHNARATARDLAFATDHRHVWEKFSPAAGPEGTLWYYRSLIAAYRAGPPDERRDLIVSDLSQAVHEIACLIADDAAARDHDELPF